MVFAKGERKDVKGGGNELRDGSFFLEKDEKRKKG